MEKPNAQSDLSNQSWAKQFLASGSRLREATELYQSMGFEVRLEPATVEDFACSGCQPQQPAGTIEDWYLIYTRPRQSAEDACDEEEELWRKLW